MMIVIAAHRSVAVRIGRPFPVGVVAVGRMGRVAGVPIRGAKGLHSGQRGCMATEGGPWEADGGGTVLTDALQEALRVDDGAPLEAAGAAAVPAFRGQQVLLALVVEEAGLVDGRRCGQRREAWVYTVQVQRAPDMGQSVPAVTAGDACQYTNSRRPTQSALMIVSASGSASGSVERSPGGAVKRSRPAGVPRRGRQGAAGQ